MRRNYAQNCTREASGPIPAPICGQQTGTAAGLRYGYFRYAAVGCAVIATRNALHLLGIETSLAEVGRRYESTGGQMLLGAWGTNPYAAADVLARYGAAAAQLETPAALEAALAARRRAVGLLSFWNDRRSPLRGIHTVCFCYDADRPCPYTVYNRFGRETAPLTFRTLPALLHPGRLIVATLAETNPAQNEAGK